MDTVQLDGKGFETLVKQGQKVKAGEPLVKFDIETIKKAGYSVITPIVVTNSKNYHAVTALKSGNVITGDTLLELN